MIDGKFEQIARLEHELKRFNERAHPFATKSALNNFAFTTRSEWQEGMRKSMTLRNTFTERSVRVVQARTLDINNQMATVGSIADFMPKQEFGGVKRKTGRIGVNIPTAYSAGQAGSKRTRRPRKANRASNIRLRQRGRSKTRKQRNAMVIKQASESANKFVYLDLGRRKGIFRVLGKRKRIRIRMVHDLTRSYVRIPANPQLAPAISRVIPRAFDMYEQALKFQIDRHQLFKRR